MRIYFHLLRRHLMQYPGRVAVGLIVLTVAAMLMLALAEAGAALKFRVGGYLSQLFPEERLTLEAGQLALGPVALEPRAINDDTVAQMKKRVEVKEVWPVEPVRFPIRIEGALFGQEFTSDAVIYGVPRELVADALRPNERWEMPNINSLPGTTLPVVVSRYLLEIYNFGLARSNGLPMLNAAYVVDKKAKLVLGESALGLAAPKMEPIDEPVHIAGLTSQPSLLGLALPADAVRAYNKAHATPPDPSYVQLVVQLRPGADREPFMEWAGTQGLRLASGDVTAGQVKQGVRAAGWGLIGLAIAVFALGMLTFYLLFAMTFHARRLDLIRLRAMGLSPRAAVGLALGEVGALALVSVVVAGVGVALASQWASGALKATLQRYEWLPPGLLDPAPLWLGMASFLILVLTLVPALPMLRWVVKVEPGQVIRDM